MVLAQVFFPRGTYIEGNKKHNLLHEKT